MLQVATQKNLSIIELEPPRRCHTDTRTMHTSEKKIRPHTCKCTLDIHFPHENLSFVNGNGRSLRLLNEINHGLDQFTTQCSPNNVSSRINNEWKLWTNREKNKKKERETDRVRD